MSFKLYRTLRAIFHDLLAQHHHNVAHIQHADGAVSPLTDVHHAHARSIDQNGHMYSGRPVRTGRTLHETLALFASPHILLKLPSPKRGPRRGELARTPQVLISQSD